MGGTFVVSAVVNAVVVEIIKIIIEKRKYLAYTSSYYTVYMYDEGDVFLR
jgi:hypothetical protein